MKVILLYAIFGKYENFFNHFVIISNRNLIVIIKKSFRRVILKIKDKIFLRMFLQNYKHLRQYIKLMIQNKYTNHPKKNCQKFQMVIYIHFFLKLGES